MFLILSVLYAQDLLARLWSRASSCGRFNVLKLDQRSSTMCRTTSFQQAQLRSFESSKAAVPASFWAEPYSRPLSSMNL